MIFTVVGIATADLAQAEMRITVSETVFDQVALKVGPITETGRFNVNVDHPCLKCGQTIRGYCVFWYPTICTSTIYSNTWTATASNIKFDIQPTGMTYTADISAEYGPCNSNTEAYGNSSVTLSGNLLRFETSRMTFPLRCEIYDVGIDITTIDRRLPYTMDIPFNRSIITNTASSDLNINTQFQNNRLQYLNNKVSITTDPLFW